MKLPYSAKPDLDVASELTPGTSVQGYRVNELPMESLPGYLPQGLVNADGTASEFSVNPEPDDLDPTWSQSFYNSFQRENELVGAYNVYMRERSFGDPDPAFNPFEYNMGTKYEPYAEMFLETFNQKHADFMRSMIDQEEEVNRIREAAGWKGFATDIIASVVSPFTLMPVGAYTKGARIASQAGQMAAHIGASNLAAGALQEGMLQNQQYLRTLEESALNTAMAGVLGGAIGGLAGGLSARSLANLQTSIAPMMRGELVESAVLAKAQEAGLITARDVAEYQSFQSGSVGAASLAPEVPVQVKPAFGVEKATGWMTPVTQVINTSPSNVAREVTANLVDIAEGLTRNKHGIPSNPVGGSVETRIKMFGVAREYQGYRAIRDLWAKHRFGSANTSIPRTRDLVSSRPPGTKSFHEFSEEVGKALARNDEHPIPEVAEAAKAWRKLVHEPLAEDAIKVGHLSRETYERSLPGYAKKAAKQKAAGGPQTPRQRAGELQRQIVSELLEAFEKRLGRGIVGRELSKAQRDALIDTIGTNPQLMKRLSEFVRGQDPLDGSAGKGGATSEDAPFAIAGRDPAGEWSKIGDRLAQGQVVDIPQTSIRAAEDMVARARALMPENVRGERVSVITNITPKGDNLQIAIRDVGGDVRSIEGTPVDGRVITVPASGFDAIAGSRFLFNPDTGDILLTGLDTVGDTPASVASGVYHEIAHRLFWAARLSGREQPALERLVDHAESFGILDRQFNDFAESVGLPDRFDDGATIRGEYERLYAGLDDDVRAGNLAEESVAHLVELYHANALTPREMELVRADMEALFGARVDEPFVDDGQGPLLAALRGRRDLDMSPEARKARAKEMGFDTEQVWYHVTDTGFDEFDLSKLGANTDNTDWAQGLARAGVWMTKDPAGVAKQTAMVYDGSRTMPLHVKGELYQFDGRLQDLGDSIDDIVEAAKAEGYSGIRLFDEEFGSESVLVFDPSNIRSVNAVFDPAESASSNLLAAIRSIADRNNAIAIDDMMPGTPHPKGKPVLGFHGTTAEHFQRFDIERSKDIGIHFGTRNQANTFAPAVRIGAKDTVIANLLAEVDGELAQARKSGDTQRVQELEIERTTLENRVYPVRENQTARIFPALVDIKNPIDMPDMGEWAPVQMARYLKRQRDIGFTDEDLAQIELLDDSDAYELIRYRLGEAGFDGIRYENRFEGDGYSYIVWNKGQVRSAIVPSNVLYAIRAWHGSPHRFEKFSMDAIGSGEGAQAFGHGLYFAENVKTAKAYKSKLEGASVWRGHMRIARTELAQIDADLKEAKRGLFGESSERKRLLERKNGLEKRIAALQKKIDEDAGAGALYEVRLNVEEDDLLDWNKPLSEQSERVKDLLNSNARFAEEFKRQSMRFTDQEGEAVWRAADQLTGDPARAAWALRNAGIKGIKYLDQGSRGVGEGTRNFVIFDDADVEIVSVNGEPVTGAKRKDVLAAIRGGRRDTPILRKIRQLGGIQDETGDLAAMDAAKRRGIIAKPGQGVTPDELREILMQDGLLSQRDMLEGDAPQLGVSDLYEAIRAELAGDLGHSRLDSGANARMEALNSAYGAYREMFGDDLVLTAEQEDLLGRLIVDDQMPMTEAMMRVARLARQGDSADIDARLSQAMDQGEAAPQGVQGDAARELGVAEVQRLFKEQTGQDLNLTPELEQLLSRILGEVGGRADDALEQFQMRRPANEAQAQGDQMPPPDAEEGIAMRRFFEELRKSVQDVDDAADDFSPDIADEIWTDAGASYIHRVYNHTKISARRQQFVAILADHFEAAQKRAMAVLGRMSKQADSGRVNAKLMKDIEDLETFAAQTRQDFESVANDVANKILGQQPGRVDLDGLPAGVRGALKSRTLRIPDTFESANGKFEDFLERDINVIQRAMIRTMVPDIELAKKFGDIEMRAALQAISDDYARKSEQAAKNLSGAALERKNRELDAKKKRDLSNIEGMRDRLRGTYGLPADPLAWTPRIINEVMKNNYVTMLGGMTISALTDGPNLAMRQGLGTFFEASFTPLIKGAFMTDVVKRGIGEELHAAGVGLEMIMPRAQAIADLWDDYGRFSKFERTTGALSDAFGYLTLMNQWNTMLKQWAGMVTINSMLRKARKIADGTASKKDIELMASMGISPEMAIRINEQFSAHGFIERGVFFANTTAWAPTKNQTASMVRETVEAFRAALAAEVDRVIVTPGQDKPLLSSTWYARMLFQFKSFPISATSRVLIPALQKLRTADLGVLVGMSMSVALGMGVEYLKALANDKMDYLPQTTEEWVWRGIVRSGWVGIIPDILFMVERGTGGVVGPSAVFGGREVGKYAARNTFDALLGPTAGRLGDVPAATGAIARAMAGKGELSQTDLAVIRRQIPLQNLIYFSWLMQQAEQAAGRALNVKPTRQRRKFDQMQGINTSSLQGDGGQATMLGGEGMDQLAPTQVAAASQTAPEALDVPRPEDDRPATLKRSGVRRNNTIPGVA